MRNEAQSPDVLSIVQLCHVALNDAERDWWDGYNNNDSLMEQAAQDALRRCFELVLYLADVLNLGRTYDRIATAFAQAQEEGLLKHEMGFEEPFLVWPVVLRDYLDAFRSGYVAESPTAVLKDLESMLRESVYSITDKRVFDEPPANETDVHNRMEAVLRCVFPDLKRKPSLSKAI
jgi:hypothetical protein